MSALGPLRFRVLRRVVQVGVLGLFWLGAHRHLGVLTGDLSSSRVLRTIPMSDPFATLQVAATGHVPTATVLIGSAVTLGVWFLLGGRSFCSWVCPVNLVSDTAALTRRWFGLPMGFAVNRSARVWLLLLALVLSATSGVAAFELVSPIGMIHRELIFGAGLGLLAIPLLFLVDLFLLRRGWCGSLCPLGAFWSLVGRRSPVVLAWDDAACNRCMDCVAVCPEAHVLNFNRLLETGFVESGDCTRCARCVEVCSTEACSLRIRPLRRAQQGVDHVDH
jgi:ferredoxin-type protein NapH